MKHSTYNLHDANPLTRALIWRPSQIGFFVTVLIVLAMGCSTTSSENSEASTDAALANVVNNEADRIVE